MGIVNSTCRCSSRRFFPALACIATKCILRMCSFLQGSRKGCGCCFGNIDLELGSSCLKIITYQLQNSHDAYPCSFSLCKGQAEEEDCSKHSSCVLNQLEQKPAALKLLAANSHTQNLPVLHSQPPHVGDGDDISNGVKLESLHPSIQL